MHVNNSISIAIVHTIIELGSRKKNLSKIKNVLERLMQHQKNVDVVILPQMINGVPIYEINFKKIFKIVSETIPGPTTEDMIKLSNKYNVDLIVGPLVERRGSKLYRSAIYVSKGGSIKEVVRQVTPTDKFNGYAQIPYITMNNAKIGFLIADDIFYPELSFIFSILDVDIIIAFPSIKQDIRKQQQIASLRALEANTMALVIGGIFEYKQDVIATIPTIVFDEYGEEMEKMEVEEKVLILNIHMKSRSVMRKTLNSRLKIINELKKLLRTK
ncbi:carbon-nitrogen hydrolase family protein [Ignisphaera sp. 4213-co]|uniref:Carbon-nitrogen hydrolase family protein n=1 Tax=Ignisphaera cupida TaxID=3050454 RepID=A0ABD4Z9T9_9CREN|nr:carbon-nitrogen hydrolase family protein [Ignisphaera sp. 4213-co]MDK6029065.1 carbon-nitrogen hydrolase family protein [Ignisphaera sp. 4213-co]